MFVSQRWMEHYWAGTWQPNEEIKHQADITVTQVTSVTTTTTTTTTTITITASICMVSRVTHLSLSNYRPQGIKLLGRLLKFTLIVANITQLGPGVVHLRINTPIGKTSNV
jgi:Na+-transporting NADH:ubiquinone oxidoreductase subunit NqrD